MRLGILVTGSTAGMVRFNELVSELSEGLYKGEEISALIAHVSVNDRDRGLGNGLSSFGLTGTEILAARKRLESPSGDSAIDSTWLRLLEG